MVSRVSVLIGTILLVCSTASYATTKDPVSASMYYKKGKVYQCVMDEGLHISDEKTRKHLLQLTSRELLDNDAVNTIKKAKPQFLDETIKGLLTLSARYEEGKDSVKGLVGKDPFIIIDECHALIPFIEKYILKAPLVKTSTDNNAPLISSWEELEKN